METTKHRLTRDEKLAVFCNGSTRFTTNGRTIGVQLDNHKDDLDDTVTLDDSVHHLPVMSLIMDSAQSVQCHIA